MTYVMSDIHGCYDNFIKMLINIKFSDADELYILGDIFDRGPEPLKILNYIMNSKNIYLIKGNHEELVMEYLNEDIDSYLYCRFGGAPTISAIDSLDDEDRKIIYKYLRNLPTTKVVLDKYILVHAELYFPENFNSLSLSELLNDQSSSSNLWGRNLLLSNIRYKDYIVVSGHTPTSNLNANNYILKKENNIYIDCGCCFDNGRLGCLRLDDLKEFYV